MCEDNIKVGANRFSRFFFEFEFWKARSLCIDIICIFQLSSIIKSHPSVSKNIQRGIYHQGALGVGEFFTCAEMELWPLLMAPPPKAPYMCIPTSICIRP